MHLQLNETRICGFSHDPLTQQIKNLDLLQGDIAFNNQSIARRIWK